jgi:hypothetical protein
VLLPVGQERQTDDATVRVDVLSGPELALARRQDDDATMVVQGGALIPLAVSVSPTTTFAPLRPLPKLLASPSAMPRSCTFRPSLVHATACGLPEASLAVPAMTPRLLMAAAYPKSPPNPGSWRM